MSEQVRLGGLGLTEDFPVPPIPGGTEIWPSIPPVDSWIGTPIPLASGPSIPIPLETTPTVPIPDLFF